MTISHEEAEQMGWDAVFDMEKNGWWKNFIFVA